MIMIWDIAVVILINLSKDLMDQNGAKNKALIGLSAAVLADGLYLLPFRKGIYNSHKYGVICYLSFYISLVMIVRSIRKLIFVLCDVL